MSPLPAPDPAQRDVADALFDALGAVALVIEVDGRLVRMNRAAEEFTGCRSAEAASEPFAWERFVPPEDRAKLRGWFDALRTRGAPATAIHHWINAHGESRLLRWNNALLDGPDGMPRYLVAVGSDITEQDRLARRSARLASYRTFLAEAGASMARAHSDTDLLQSVCELAVRHAGVCLAWVASPDDALRMRVVAAAGPARAYLEGIEISADPRVPLGQGTIGRCWNEAHAFFNVSFAASPMLLPWRRRAEEHGLQASAVLPIRRGQAMLGVLTLFSDEQGFFDSLLQELLLELAADIEYGLDHLQLRQLNKALVDHTDAGVAVVGERRCVFANARMAQLLGFASRDQLAGMDVRELFVGDGAWESVARDLPRLASEGVLRLPAVAVRRRDGSSLSCDLIGVRLDAQRSVWTVLDVTAREAQRLETEQLQRLYRALLAEGDVVLRARDEAQMLQQTCERLVGDTPFHVAALRRPDAQGWMQTLARAGPGSDLLEGLRVHVDDPRSLVAQSWREARAVLRNDNLLAHRGTPWLQAMRELGWESALVAPVHRGGKPWAVLVFIAPVRDAFQQQTLRTCEQVCELLGHGLDELDLKLRLRQLQSEDAHRARHDALTELPNRFALEQHLPQAMARASRSGKLLAVGLLDLDDFKPVNDSHGHAAGDVLLQQLAQRLRRLLRSGDFLARLGGDEFVVVFEELDAAQAVLQLDTALRRLHQAVDAPFDLGQGRIGRIGLSLGLALYPTHGDDAERLLRRADAAMYAVKAHKHQRLRWWEVARQPGSSGA